VEDIETLDALNESAEEKARMDAENKRKQQEALKRNG
jgi:hypothetical protein